MSGRHPCNRLAQRLPMSACAAAHTHLRHRYLTDHDRDEETPIITVNAGAEPDMFTACFAGWDDTAASAFEDPYEKRMRALKEKSDSDGGGGFFVSLALQLCLNTRQPLPR